jgi:hypothetical protein
VSGDSLSSSNSSSSSVSSSRSPSSFGVLLNCCELY